MLTRSRLARTEIALIIDVYPVGNGLEAVFCGKSLHHMEKFIFAMEAPLAVIPDVFRSVHFAGLDHLNGNPMFLRECESVLKLGTRQAGRICDQGQHVLAKDLACDPCQIGRIDATGISD